MKLKQQSQYVQQPVSHRRSYRRPQCRAKADVPMCSDDDWVSKCPSGCRLQGLISKMDSEVERKLRKVCKTGMMYEDAAERSMKAMTHIDSHNRRVIVDRYMSDLKFVEQAERLTRNLTSLRNRSSMLSQQLEEMNHRVQKQIEDLYRAEVDIDMKLRACKGSCHSAIPFDVSHPSYEALQNDMEQLDRTFQHRKAAVPPQDIPHLTLQPVDVDQASSSEYKTIPTVQREGVDTEVIF
ncbi:fibrinogen alpha chain [Halichoeres trimaculatus]|uniref:fibrinogen alpha chain n=1 Tax=Halichoeres trimaculatus TaxID=147232 RepID=UPI003D9F9675